MICFACRVAADYDKPTEHEKCSGCECQHLEKGKYIGRLQAISKINTK